MFYVLAQHTHTCIHRTQVKAWNWTNLAPQTATNELLMKTHLTWKTLAGRSPPSPPPWAAPLLSPSTPAPFTPSQQLRARESWKTLFHCGFCKRLYVYPNLILRPLTLSSRRLLVQSINQSNFITVSPV